MCALKTSFFLDPVRIYIIYTCTSPKIEGRAFFKETFHSNNLSKEVIMRSPSLISLIAVLLLAFLSCETLAFESKYAGKVNEVTSGTAWHFLQPTGADQGEIEFLHNFFVYLVPACVAKRV